MRDMNASINLLDKYKKECSIISDNACAHSLGVGRSAVSKWRNGDGHPDADLVAVMCEATGEPIAKWVPLIEAERARSPSVKKVWLRLAQAAASIALVYLFSRLNVHQDIAGGLALFFAKPAHTVYYVKLQK